MICISKIIENINRNIIFYIRVDMRVITIYLPEMYLDMLEVLRNNTGISRSELIRIAIKDRLEKDKQLLLELKKKRITKFYNYCIECESRLHISAKPIEYKDFKVFDLRFCCSCYKKYEGKSLEELPNKIKRKIKRKIERFNKSIKKD
jgi:Arc/MetJ-type ribon-helix-helix transcriptional regulator